VGRTKTCRPRNKLGNHSPKRGRPRPDSGYAFPASSRQLSCLQRTPRENRKRVSGNRLAPGWSAARARGIRPHTPLPIVLPCVTQVDLEHNGGLSWVQLRLRQSHL